MTPEPVPTVATPTLPELPQMEPEQPEVTRASRGRGGRRRPTAAATAASATPDVTLDVTKPAQAEMPEPQPEPAATASPHIQPFGSAGFMPSREEMLAAMRAGQDPMAAFGPPTMPSMTPTLPQTPEVAQQPAWMGAPT